MLVDHIDSWTGTHYQARVDAGRRRPAARASGPGPPRTFRSRAPPSSASALAACVVALASFFPQIVDASEVSNRYHHLDHAGQFFLGAIARSAARLAAVRLTPARRPLLARPRDGARRADADDARDGAAHLRAARSATRSSTRSTTSRWPPSASSTGLGATRLGLVTGRLMFVLSVGMPLMFAAAMK